MQCIVDKSQSIMHCNERDFMITQVTGLVMCVTQQQLSIYEVPSTKFKKTGCDIDFAPHIPLYESCNW